MTSPTDFTRFMTALAGDARLGPLVAPLVGQQAEAVVLALAVALDRAMQGQQPHPAHSLLERLSDAEGGVIYSPSRSTAPSAPERAQ